MPKQSLFDTWNQLLIFTEGACPDCLNLPEKGISGTILGTIFEERGPMFFPNRIRDGRQALTLILKRAGKYYHINLVALLKLARAGSDMPEDLEPQWESLMAVTENEHWNPSDFNAYIVGDHLDAQNGCELTMINGESQEYLLVLSRKGSGTSTRLNLASLIAMARYADLPAPEITCGEILQATLAEAGPSDADAEKIEYIGVSANPVPLVDVWVAPAG